VQLTRRALLGIGVSAAVLTACNGKKPSAQPSPTSTPTPDAAALAGARRDEIGLLAAYDHLITRTPLHKRGPLQVERAIHATHLSALRGTEGPPRRRDHDINQALLRSAQRLRRLSLTATSGANAALLASIAASHTASAT
jgi:hypothetical protein